MIINNFVVIATYFQLVRSFEEHLPVIKTQLGTVVGYHRQSYAGRVFSAFEGIPYAKPPTGNLRFEEPQPYGLWLESWVANKTYTCIQLFGKNIYGEEDCLYLNIYVPKQQPRFEDNFDVVVHIHGGAFVVGSPSMAGPEFLMDRNIIYVNLNYRLGVMGFLSTEDEVVKGNMGLKDQVMALKWIQNNIKQFGGNPLSVTLIGLSAGAVSTHFHYFSPQSKGLFHRGISHSGTALAPWAIQKSVLRNTKLLASLIGCDFIMTKDLVNCLRQKPANSLLFGGHTTLLSLSAPLIPFGPIIEKKSKSAFLADHPFRLLERGEISDIPWITSITTEEGILGARSYMNYFDKLDNQWTDLAPLILSYNDTCPTSIINSVSLEIKKYYFGNESISTSSIRKFIELFGDRHFVLNFEKSVRMQRKINKTPIYSYIYGYNKESTENSALFKSYGVGHGDDRHLLYTSKFSGLQEPSLNFTKNDELIKDILVDIVVTFAKMGKPVVENAIWYPTNASKDFGYLFIKNPKNVSMEYKNEIGPQEFWKSLKLKEDEYYEV